MWIDERERRKQPEPIDQPDSQPEPATPQPSGVPSGTTDAVEAALVGTPRADPREASVEPPTPTSASRREEDDGEERPSFDELPDPDESIDSAEPDPWMDELGEQSMPPTPIGAPEPGPEPIPISAPPAAEPRHGGDTAASPSIPELRPVQPPAVPSHIHQPVTAALHPANPPAVAAQSVPARPVGSALTVEAVARDKALPAEYLRELGVADSRRGVIIGYQAANGQRRRARLRTALVAAQGSRWMGPKELQVVPYGLWRLEEAKLAGYLIIVAGESDCWTLWHHGFPALGLPGRGATMTKKLETEYLDEIKRVVIIREQDEESDAFVDGVVARLKTLAWAGEVAILEMPEGVKDPNELHKLEGEEFKDAFQQLLEQATPLDDDAPSPAGRILETRPRMIARPLCLVGDRAYAASWPWIEPRPGEEPMQTLVILREDGRCFTDAPIPNAFPLRDLGLIVRLDEIPLPTRLWSGRGVEAFRAGIQPDPGTIFRKCVDVVQRFIDFRRSLSDQGTMCEFIACYILMTYLLDAFNVVGYLWPSGDKGSGKTHLLHVVAELAYLGLVVLAGGSYATLRDLADYGACLAFDDSEAIMDSKKTDPDKRTLLLAGNRRGALVTLKEPAGGNRWKTRHVHAFCPRLFSAINLPDAVLGSRTITVPAVRSADENRVNADPLDHSLWPHDREQLIDDLWAMGLAHLACLRRYDQKAAATASLKGRALEPWRAVLAVAQWLEEEHGQVGLFERMDQLSLVYQEERTDLETDLTHVLILALRDMLSRHEDESITVDTESVTIEINSLAHQTGLAELGEDFSSSKQVGRRLQLLRFRRALRQGNSRAWRVTRDELRSLAEAYGMKIGFQVQHGPHGALDDTATHEAPSHQVGQERQDVPDTRRG